MSATTDRDENGVHVVIELLVQLQRERLLAGASLWLA